MKNRNRILVIALLALFALFALVDPTTRTAAQSNYEPYTFTTVAGAGGNSTQEGIGSAARFWFPTGVAVDKAGNLYATDQLTSTIVKVTPAGLVTTLAGLAGRYGSADGSGVNAQFNVPWGVAVDTAGNVYVADANNSVIRKVTPAGLVTTLAGLAGSPGSKDGAGPAARFNNPLGIAVDSTGTVYVSDNNNTIRKVTPEGMVTTLAGFAELDVNGNPVGGNLDGTGSEARFNNPQFVAVDNEGNVYVADSDNNTIRKVTALGEVTTLAGCASCPGETVDGTGLDARFNGALGIAVDSAGNVYVGDGPSTIRKVTPDGQVTTLAGLAGSSGNRDGSGSDARFDALQGVAVDSDGNVYVADLGNSTIRRVTPAGVVTTVAGLGGLPGTADGVLVNARFRGPSSVAVDKSGNIYVADRINHAIRKITSAGVVATLAGSPGIAGSADGTGTNALFNGPSGVAVDSAGNVYVADFFNHTLRKITPGSEVTTLAGSAGSRGIKDGTGADAKLGFVTGVAVDTNGNVYLAAWAGSIRKVTPAGDVTTLAGLAGNDGSTDGTGSNARFNNPQGLAVDGAGNVFVADTGNFTIRKVTTPAGVVTTLAGLAGSPGTADGTERSARFTTPFGLAVDSAGNVYVADTFNSTIRKVTPAGVVTTLGGVARTAGGADGLGSAARFNSPNGIAVDGAGNLYVADYYLNTIRKGSAAFLISGFGFTEGQFSFNFIGPTGPSVVVEASTDLVGWLPIWTNTFAGALNFSDPQSDISSNRFYRAHLR